MFGRGRPRTVDPIPDEVFDLAARIVAIFIDGTRAQFRALSDEAGLADDVELRANLIQIATSMAAVQLGRRRLTGRLPDHERQADMVAELCRAREFGELVDPFAAASFLALAADPKRAAFRWKADPVHLHAALTVCAFLFATESEWWQESWREWVPVVRDRLTALHAPD